MKKRTWLLIIVLIAAVAGFFIYRNVQARRAAAATRFQTQALTRGDLTALVGATGTVRANQTAMLNWQTTGTVGKINAQVGDKVGADQILAELTANSLPQNVIMAESDLITAQRNLEDLRDSNAQRAKAQQTVANAQKAVDDAQKSVDSKSYTKASQDVIDTAYANYILAQNTVDDKQKVFDGVSYKAEDDPNRAAALSDLAAAKQRRDNALANYNEAKSRPDQVDVSIAQANLDVAKANLQDAQREYNRVKNGADPNDIAAAEAKVQAAQTTLAMAYIKAPFNGTITDVNANLGDQVGPTTNAFRIDDLSRLLIDVQITEVDINRVQVGQPVTMTFDAISDKEYNGKVVEVGRVGTAVQGVVNFNVTVEISNPDSQVRPGMTAAVNIVVNQIKDVLLVPNRAVRQRQGQFVVYILQNGLPKAEQVQIGATSDTNSEIVSGNVKEGDPIIMNPPAIEFGAGGGIFRPGGGGGTPKDGGQ